MVDKTLFSEPPVHRMVPDAQAVGITVCMVFGEKNDVSLISIVD
jgi:hypothetical protein